MIPEVNKTNIRRLIPHSGDMCLLDKVVYWDQTQIECLAISHRDPHNPLVCQGHLNAIHLIEYGAQAIAVHGGLLAESQNKSFRPGYLAGIHDANFNIDTVDRRIPQLIIHASTQMQSDSGVIYQIQIHRGDNKKMLIKARATVIHLHSDTDNRE